jgi:GNAT superfamily N-acetyltransferase
VSTPEFTIVDPASPPARWALREYFSELDRRFVGGFDVEAALAEPPAALVAPSGLFLLAVVAGADEPAACGGIVFVDEAVGEIKRMWVHPSHRGRGLAGSLLGRLEQEIAATGRNRVVLDTNGVLLEAIAMYGRHGYTPIERYNDNPYAQHWFAKQLG